MTPITIKDITTDALAEYTVSLGHDARVARQIQGLAMRNRLTTWPDEPPRDFGRRKWEDLRAKLHLPNLELVEKVESPQDGFCKYLFRGDGPELFEAVRIPLLHRSGDEKYVLCVSSQVGCSAACAFCATGRLGFKRNLKTWEIVDQVVKVSSDSDYPIRGIVFMGMGEPMLNYERVMRAARIMTDPSGLAIDGKCITISTVGIAPGIRRFTRDHPPHRLILSLTSAIPEKRAELLPMTKLYGLPTLIDALREYHHKTRRRIPLAWTVISGVNTGEDEAIALAALVKDLPVIIDLIPVNDDTGRFQRALRPELHRFMDYLRDHVRQPIVCRYSGGLDIAGACGMLAGKRLAGNPEVSQPQ